MSTAPMPAPSPIARKMTFRHKFPLYVIAFGVLGGFLAMNFPAEELERVWRVSGVMILAQLCTLLLVIWFIGFSGLRWTMRLGVLACVVAAVFGLVRSVGFTGDMVPFVKEWRFGSSRNDVLDAFRQQRQPGAAPQTAELAGDRPTDYPEYRNRLRDGVITGPTLARDWKADPPRKIWRQPCGGGYSSFAIAGSSAITIEQRRGDEAVVCYDTQTGQERWVYSYPALFSETLGGDGPRATPTIKDGEVYSLGATGHLACLDAATGKDKWHVNILDNNDNIVWAMSGSPLVFDDVVVVNPGTQKPSAEGRAVQARDRKSGKLVWQSGKTRAGYSSPQMATLCGKQQILLFDGDQMAGYDPKTGKELWNVPWEVNQGINVSQPITVDETRVFISSGYGVGCALLQLEEKEGAWTVKPLYKNLNMRCRFTSPILYKGHLYGLDEGILVCLDVENGKRKWKGGRYGHGQMLLSDDLLVILSEQGKLVLVEATPEAHKELASVDAIEGRTWNYPALSNGRAYVRNHLEMACYDLTPSKGK